ncbi:copper resistance CopC/CopD family protein [Azospirillum thiophilum]|uniref:copper resistance CopC/CopD family protein n=1 Tax=Azospirillum thiophilum TaxID=528244 RepID=UPI00069889A4|nr:copper resistance protein CopC [Azospirillum thiophilum]
MHSNLHRPPGLPAPACTPFRALFRVVLLLALAGMAAIPRTGWAHAVLMESVPADGATLDAPPAELRLSFNEPVSPIRFQLLDQQGRDMADPAGTVAENDTVRLALPPGLPQGLYVASYRMTSADGHPVAGSFTFGIGMTPPPPAATPEPDDPARTAALAGVLLRALHYAALLAGTGGGLFLLLVGGRSSALSDRVTPALGAMLLAAGLSGLLLVGVTGAVLTGQPLAALATASAWSTGAGSSVGLSIGIAALALLCTAGGLAGWGRSKAGWLLLAAGALLGALSLAATGHAATAPPRWLAAPLVALHGLMAAFWVGALWPLAVALRLEPAAEAARLTRRFSRLAVGAVAVLAGAGAILSVLQLRPAGAVSGSAILEAILSTGYGWLWSGKMLAVLLLLGLAAWNRQSLTPALDRGGTGPVRALRRSIALEMAVAGTILLLSASFALTPRRAHGAAGWKGRRRDFPSSRSGTAIWPSSMSIRRGRGGTASGSTSRTRTASSWPPARRRRNGSCQPPASPRCDGPCRASAPASSAATTWNCRWPAAGSCAWTC